MMKQGVLSEQTRRVGERVSPWIRLTAAILGILGVWLYALPWIANQPPVSQRLQWLEEQGIDPSAMYYTELDAMKPLLDKLNRSERRPCQGHFTP